MSRPHDASADERVVSPPANTGGPPGATSTEVATGRQETTVVEAVATAVGGMAVGLSALWFLAPICFTC